MPIDTPVVQSCPADQVSPVDSRRLKALRELVYPPSCSANRPRPPSDPPTLHDWPDHQQRRLFFIRDGAAIVAMSQLIPRRIQTERGPMDLLGLAGVKTHPDYRGQGFGRAVVRAALGYVDNGTFAVSLFQTGVPGFYEKLSCRRVENTFVNSHAPRPATCPWWEAHVMIYPAAFDWPPGRIDLLGPGW